MAAQSDSLGQDLKAWAADQLQVEAGAALPQLRAAYLRQVQNDQNGPNLAAREALLILSGRNNAVRPTLALDAAEAQLQRDLDEYASQFFSLAISDRKAEWERLHARGQGFVRIDARLAALRPGIYLILPPVDGNTHLGELVTAVCELFVLRPPARAARRQAILRDMTHHNDVSWAVAADRLLKNHPAIAALDSELVARLSDADALADENKRAYRKMRKAVQTINQGSSGKWGWGVVVAVIILVRLLTALTNSNNSNSPFTPPPNAQPPFDFNELMKNKKFIVGPDGKVKAIPDRPPDDDKKEPPAEPPKDKQAPP